MRSVTTTPSSVSWCALSGLLLSSATMRHVERAEHLCRHRVVALVLAVPEREVSVVRVETGILQGVRVELVVQPDAAPFLPQIQQVPAGVG